MKEKERKEEMEKKERGANKAFVVVFREMETLKEIRDCVPAPL